MLGPHACRATAFLILLQTLFAYAEATGDLGRRAQDMGRMLQDLPTCLPNAVPRERRVNMPDLNGTGSVPFGLWVLMWDSAVLAATVARILAEEVIGYNTAFSGMGSASPSGLYATMGCRDPSTVYGDPQCSNANPAFEHHAALEIWGMTSINAETRFVGLQDIRPDDVGDMGYSGVEGLYVFTQEKEKAYKTEGLALEYYRSYNATWNAPQAYFDNYTAFDPSDLLFCNQTRMSSSQGMDFYVAATGDFDGAVSINGTLAPRCYKDSWFLAPACRSRPETCLPALASPEGWGILDFMQQAGAFNMPVAIAAAKTWSTAPRTAKTLAYWWQPDSTFIDLRPTIVTFPPFNELERAQGIRTSMIENTRLSKWVHNRLLLKAPLLVDFMKQIRITPTSITEMLALNKQMGGQAWAQVACYWIRTNPLLWNSWIPIASKCPLGFGIVSPSGAFQSVRTNTSTCSLCSAGTYSNPYRDDIGLTHLCQDCPVGKSTDGKGSTECASCRPGFFAPRGGSSSCEACPTGTYSESLESTSCVPCSGDFVTQYPGAVSRDQCICPEGSYRPLNSTVATEGVCVQCPEGMTCELGSDIRYLGLPRAGLTQYPYLKPRYWSSFEEPLHVFECPSVQKCPGGAPGAACAEQLGGIACTYCDGEQYWDGDACAECIASTVLFPVLPTLMIPLVVIVMYRGAQGSLQSWDSGKNAVMVTAYILVAHYQMHSLLKNTALELPRRISGIMDFWGLANDVFSVFQPNCIGYDSFQAKSIVGAAIPLGVIVVTLLTMGASRLVAGALRKEKLRMKFDGVHHIMGSFMFTFFNGIVSQSLNLFNCSTNPNGLYTMASDRSIVCYESDTWRDMLALSIVSTLLYCGGVTLAVLYAVGVARRNENFKNVGFQTRWKFLFSKFRSDAYWFGLVCLTRGTLVNIGLVVVETDIGKLYWIFSVIMLYTMFVVQTMPFRWVVCNNLDLMCSLSLTYQCTILVQFTRASSSIADFISYVMIVFIFLPCASLLPAVGQLLSRSPCRSPSPAGAQAGLFDEIKESCAAIAFMPEEVGQEMVKHLGEWDKVAMKRFNSLVEEEVLGRPGNRLTSGHTASLYGEAARQSSGVAQRVSSRLRNSHCSTGCHSEDVFFEEDGKDLLTSDDDKQNDSHKKDDAGFSDEDNMGIMLTPAPGNSKWSAKVARAYL